MSCSCKSGSNVGGGINSSRRGGGGGGGSGFRY